MSLRGYQKHPGVEGLYYRLNAKGNKSFYVRLHWRENGKKRTSFQSLKTDKLSVAKERLKTKMERHRQTTELPKDTLALTLGNLLTELKRSINAAPDTADQTRAAKLASITRLVRAWPAMATTPAVSFTRELAETWATRLKTLPLRPPPPNTSGPYRPLSSSSVNQSLAILKQLGLLATAKGLIPANIADRLPRARTQVKKVTDLPSRADFEKLLSELRHPYRKTPADDSAKGRTATVDFAEGLIFTGCRIDELTRLTWGDVYWERNQLHVPGTKSQKSDRIIPLIPPARALLERLHTAAKSELDPLPPTSPIFKLKRIDKGLTAACARAGIARLTHHDFRHFFVTLCIESGVDFKTIAEWVGHSDGGVLVAKTYGHLRDEHSQASAAKVAF